MEINIEAMQKTFELMYNNTYMTVHTRSQIAEYLQDPSRLDVFDEESRKELSRMFWSTIEPLYRGYTEDGQRIPNIFADIGAGEEDYAKEDR